MATRETGGFAGDDVEAVVFGGYALETETGEKKTRPRMMVVQDYLENRWDMRVMVAEVGSKWVKLDLTLKSADIADSVELQSGLVSRKPHQNSVSAKSKTKSPHKGGHRRIGSL